MIFRRSLVGALFGLALMVFAHAGIEITITIDGAWWRSQPEAVKIAYVMGAIDHAGMGNPDLYANRLRGVRATCAALDRFYEVPANRKVLVIEALPAALFAR